MKKQLRLSTAAILAASTVVAVAGPTTSVEAASYKDVSPNANYYEALMELSQLGIISGYADGSFKPNAKITRGQVAKILTRMLSLQPSNSMQFSDISKDHDFYAYASAVVEAGYMDKEKGKFNAKQTLTRNEYAEILTKAFDLQTSTVNVPFLDVNAQYAEAIKAVYSNGIMKGVNKTRFNGTGELTRSQIVLTLHRAMQLQEEDGGDQPLTEVEKQSVIISAVNSTYIITDEGDLLLTTPELQNLMRATNASALRDAELEVYVKNGRIVKVEKLTLYNDKAITQTLDGNGDSISFPIVVDGNYFILQNMTVPSVETIDFAEGSLTLKNVVVTEDLTVQDGMYSKYVLRLMDSKIPKLNVNRDDVMIEGTSKLEKIFVAENVYDFTIMMSVGDIQFASNQDFILRGIGSIDYIHVPLNSSITLRNTGKIKKLHVEDIDAQVYIEGDIHIDAAVIPKNADYNSIFSYYASIQKYISKLSYPNSSMNLLYAEVNKPSKEEIAYNRALENVIKSHEHSLTEAKLTIRTNFNEILEKMEEVPISHNLYVLNHPSNGALINISFKTGGQTSNSGSFNIDALNSGIVLEEEMPYEVDTTLGGYFTNGQIAHTINFHTKRELIIRTAVEVDGVEKSFKETVINEGNKKKMDDALAVMLDSYTTAADANVATANIKFKKIDEIVDELSFIPYIKLESELPEEVEDLPLTIIKGEEVVFEGIVSVQDLKNGVSLVALTMDSPELLADFIDNGSYQYTYEFDTTEQLDVKLSFKIDDLYTTEGEVVTLNEIDEQATAFTSNDVIPVNEEIVAMLPTAIALQEEMPIKWTAHYNSTTIQ